MIPAGVLTYGNVDPFLGHYVDVTPAGWSGSISGLWCSPSGQTVMISKPYYNHPDNVDMWISTNYGSSWTQRTTVAWNGNTAGLYSLSASDDGVYVLAAQASGSNAYSNIYISSNSGVSFTASDADSGDVGGRACCSSDAGIIYLCTLTHSSGTANGGRVWKSTNYGSSWTDTQCGGNIDRMWSLPDCSADGQTVLVADYVYPSPGEGKLYLSTNGGTGWSDISASLDGSPAIYYSPTVSNDGQYLTVQSTSGLWISSNGGSSWDLSSQTLAMATIDVSDTNKRIVYFDGVAYPDDVSLTAVNDQNWVRMVPSTSSGIQYGVTVLNEAGTIGYVAYSHSNVAPIGLIKFSTT